MSGTVRRVGEFILFCSLIVVSSIAVAAVALAAPVVLAASAVSALLPGKHAPRGWRPVTA